MQNAEELIEKYKSEIEQMIKNRKYIPSEQPKFPKFQPEEDGLSKKIEKILNQNTDIADETDLPGAPYRETIMAQQSITPTQNEISNETEEQIVSQTCIRGGQLANFSPPANTGSGLQTSEQSAPSGSVGTIQIEVSAASRALPIENAIIRIRDADDKSLKAVLITNQNGITDVIELAAPYKALSQTPEVENPFADYFADVVAPGFISRTDIPIQMFGSIKSILPITLIPAEQKG